MLSLVFTNAARDTEYAEVLERLPKLRRELARNAPAEVEESEANLERFRTWLSKSTARDYFTQRPAARSPATRSTRPPPSWPRSRRAFCGW